MDGLLGANHFGDTRFESPVTKLRRKPELGTRHMIHNMAKVTCDRWLSTTCTLLDGMVTAVALQYLFHLHFLFHLLFGLLFRHSLGKG